ncbi:MAG: hypothetical protein WBP12_02150 [Candidatus Saccharimonas sp.]
MTDKQPLEPSELSDLYPKAKSYDELAAERTKIHEVKESQKPKLIQLQTSLLLTAGCALAAGAVWLVPLLAGINVMTGVFAAFGFLLAIALFIWQAIKRINYLYDTHGHDARPFLVIYLLLLGCSVALLQTIGWDKVVTDKTTIAVVFFLHFAVTQTLARMTRKIGKS